MFEKSGVKLQCLTGEGKSVLVRIIGSFEKPRVQEIGILLYNVVYITSAVTGRCPRCIRVQTHGCRDGKLVLFVLSNMARGFESVCEIISV